MNNTSNVLEYLIERLEKAKEAATLTNASFGFPHDRIEIKNVHFGDDRTGRVGDQMHPTEYVRKITELHHRTWIISPINEVIELLRLHADIIRGSEQLVNALKATDLDCLIERAKAGKV